GAKISMAKLHEASGSPMRLSDFAIRIRRIVERNEIPQYHLRIYRNDDNQEIVEMRPRALMGPSE
ncbi:MAG TPA: replication protein A, partial [Alphaproteobacteria bacterium]|nr:replication protein A [Alphaproteobacteria bacterium]